MRIVTKLLLIMVMVITGAEVHAASVSLLQPSPIPYQASLIADDAGNVWKYGGYEFQSRPVQCQGINDMVAISAGSGYSLALKSDGTVWSWGEYRDLGDGSLVSRPNPQPIPGLSEVKYIHAGTFCSVVIKRDGNLWAWRANQLPTQLANMSDVKKAISGGTKLLMLKTDGTVWISDLSTPSILPVKIALSGIVDISSGLDSYNSFFALRYDGKVLGWRNGSTNPCFVEALDNVISIDFPYAIKDDGSIWTYSTKSIYPVNPNPKEPAAPLSANLTDVISVLRDYYGNASIALKKDGTVYSWGVNYNGLLGTGEPLESGTSQPTLIEGLTDIKAISISASHCLALQKDGTIWAWGENIHHELAGPDLNTNLAKIYEPLSNIRSVATNFGSYLALRNDNRVLSWGQNSVGELGDGTTVNRDEPALIENLDDVKEISANNRTCLAVKHNGTVWTWGSKTDDRLGYAPANGSFSDIPTQVPGLDNVKTAIMGVNSAFALKNDGTVWVWGSNRYASHGKSSQIVFSGLEQITTLSDIIAISGNKGVFTALKSDGTVWHWGQYFPISLSLPPSEIMAVEVPAQVPGLSGIKYINTVDASCYAIDNNGDLWVWGDNGEFELLYNVRNFLYPPTKNGITEVEQIFGGSLGILIKDDGSLFGWKSDVSGLPPLNPLPLLATPIITQGDSVTVDMSVNQTPTAWVAPTVTATDSDTSAAGLTWSLITPPVHGTAEVSGNGLSPQTFTYDPDEGFYGTDTFFVMVSDGVLVDVVKVLVNVEPQEGYVPAQTSAPVASLAQGAYGVPQTLELSSATTGASIRYTVNGNEPTKWAGLLYTGPIAVKFPQTIKAIAFKDLETPSEVTEVSYSIDLGTPPVVAQGDVFSVIVSRNNSPFAWVAPTLTATDAESGPEGLFWGIENFPLHGKATVFGAGASPTTFTYVPSQGYSGDDSFKVYVTDGYFYKLVTINVTVIGRAENPVFSVPDGLYTTPQTVELTSSTPGATIYYSVSYNVSDTNGTLYTGPITISANTTMYARAYSPYAADSSQIIPASYSFKVAQPVFTPPAGTYKTAATVAIASPSPGAQFRYTLDGTTPTNTAGTLYTAPIYLSASKTLKAVGFKAGSTNSNVISGDYVITTQTAATPVVGPAGGLYTTEPTVSITSATPGATIRFTTDGTIPTQGSGLVYAGPFTLYKSATVKAVAYVPGTYGLSGVGYTTYTLKVGQPIFTPPQGTYSSAQSVAIVSKTNGSTIRYTLDGSTPTSTNGTVYSGPVTISATQTLKAAGFKTGYTDSNVISSTYTIVGATSATPAFSPVGGTYTNTQTITLTSATAGATIRYTTDYTTPTQTSGTIYTAPFKVLGTTAVKAIAYKPGTNGQSAVASVAYTLKVAQPTATAGGTFPSAKSVTLATATAGATLRYTLDGTTPTASTGTVYSAPISIAKTATLKVRGFKGGFTDSNVVTATYVISNFTEPYTGMEFVWVPAGSFTMGDTFGVGEADETTRTVTISKGFYLSVFETTQEQWTAVMGSNPSYWQGSGMFGYPVESVSYQNVVDFIAQLNTDSGLTFRLPTEAEWEYAAGYGNPRTKWAGTSDEAQVDNFVWTNYTSNGMSNPIGNKQGNALGLYDMSGNVWEWVSDWYGLYGTNPETDPQGPAEGTGRVFRGGSWYDDRWNARVSNRAAQSPTASYYFIGFRLVLQ